MPIISRFFGITIRMYHDDHPPPHVHAEYQGYEAFIEIDTSTIFKGHLPRRAAHIVQEWCLEHKIELGYNWMLAQQFEPLEHIPGADND